MLIKLSEAVASFGLNIKGVIHIGAHFGQEYEEYQTCGISKLIFIEPCRPAFEVLKKRFRNGNGVTLVNCALGASEGTAVMNVETANRGQSNSILRPKAHLKQYPSIRFHRRETVQLKQLDSLETGGCNMINMDVQGYELEVLKGATETLKQIDYIYTEVNRDELYEACARVEQLDDFLKDFQRVYTNWGGGTWGDAIYVRVQPAKQLLNIVDVPYRFRPHIKYPYPSDNDLIFEEWYYQNYEPSKRVYLPVFWTSYYVNNDYGKDMRAIRELQAFINSLDKSKKYFTIVQYDDGILNDISGLDILVYGMCGKGAGYNLPLLCKPHKFDFNLERDILANFIGRVTHPIRKQMIDALPKSRNYYVSEKKHSLEDYCKIIASSTFTLCPRGYGATSFRICEALQYGSIPVYISDEWIDPHGMHDFYLRLMPEDDIDAVLTSLPSSMKKTMKDSTKHFYENYFTYSANKKIIETNNNSSV